uniref:Riboflavin kinase n=1 Tax=Rhabditophanes sp. KR3021 TaxID=114890 RepID=A0AC35UGN1_9BILA
MLLNELIRNIKRSDDERELASSIISRLVTNLPFETARFLVTGMVPGMISTYTKVCADEGHKCPTLDQKEEPSVLNVLTSLNSTLLRSHHDGVRYNVLLLNMKIGTIFGLRYQSIKTPIFFVAAYLDSDPDEETKIIAKQVLQRIQLTDPIVFTTLTTDVVHNYLTAIGMPEYVSNEVEKHLAMILSCLTYFDPRQLENIAIYSRIFIERLAVALAVNIKNVTVLNEDYSDIKNCADFFRKIPFVYVSNYEVILKIGQELNRLEDVVKFFNGMLSTLKNTIDIASQMGYLIVCLAVLIPMEQKDEHDFNSMASSFKQFSMKQLNIYEPRYHKLNKHNAVRSKVESNSNESFYVCLLHVLNCQFILKIKSKQVQSDLLVDTFNLSMTKHPTLPLYFRGKVVHGYGRGGKQLNCPTANLDHNVVELLPKDLETGVYCGLAKVNDGEMYPMVMSLGFNPHFQNQERTLEVHILHTFDTDFYNAELSGVALNFIRPMWSFKSLDELIEAIEADKTFAKKYLVGLDVSSYLTNPYFSNDSNDTK